MKHEDIVVQASKALRDAYSGEAETAALARQRILVSVSRKPSKRWFRWFLGTPLLALVGGTAWAAQAGHLEAAWRTVATALSSHSIATVSIAPTTVSPLSVAALATMSAAAAADDNAPASQAALEARVPSLGPALLGPRPLKSRPTASIETRASNTQEVSAAVSAAPAMTSPDPELSLFRRAHELHFVHKNVNSAELAYREYLRQFPRGRFVPEARYNLALNHILQGARSLARTELEPFAGGQFGGYRQTEAQQLLEALP